MTQPSVLITGAGSGIGLASAIRFARAGFRVGAFDIDRSALESLPVRLGKDHHVDFLDVRDPESWQRALQEFAGRTGQLDILVNNAGILQSGPFATIPLVDQRRTVEVNVIGVLTGCHLAHPYLRNAPRPRVINLASASAIYGQPQLATYSATKFAVRGLTEALDLEWRPDGIAVRALWPLFVDTGMISGVDIGSTRTLGVHLTAEDVAEQVLRLATARQRPGGSVHRAVGRQARALLTLSSVTPSWLLRAVNGRVAGE